MGWKNIKDHYRIGHIVQIREGRFCIGSPYVPDLIRVTFDGVVSWGNLGPSENDDLARYYAEMTCGPGKLSKLIKAPDTFKKSVVVFTYEGGEIVEKQCENYGWPNVTHDGLLMYDNSFSAKKENVVRWAKRNAAAGVELTVSRLAEIKEELAKMEGYWAVHVAEVAKLERDYPGVQLSTEVREEGAAQ